LIEVRSKIRVTPEELRKIEEVGQNRFRLSQTLFDKPKNSRASYSPETKEVTEEFV